MKTCPDTDARLRDSEGMDGLLRRRHEGDRDTLPTVLWQHSNPLGVGMDWKEAIASTSRDHIASGVAAGDFRCIRWFGSAGRG